jgi:hypothetical protein
MDDTFDLLFDKLDIRIFIYTIFILHFLYIFIFFPTILGKETTTSLSKYVEYLNIFIEFYICFFLIIKYHPFRKYEFNKYDGQVIFFCALFLLINLAISFNIKIYIKKYLPDPIASTVNTALDLNIHDEHTVHPPNNVNTHDTKNTTANSDTSDTKNKDSSTGVQSKDLKNDNFSQNYSAY